MDELQSVRELFAEPAPPSAQVAARARRRATGARRRVPRARWTVSGLGLAAAATAAAVFAATQPGGSEPSEPAPVSARQVLLTAAASSARIPSSDGTYWFTESQEGELRTVTGKYGSYTVVNRSEVRDWTNAHSPHRTDAETKAGRGGTTTHYWAERDLGARPAEASDVAAWKRDGSPSTFSAPIPGGSTERLDAKATPWKVHKEETAFNSAFPDGSLQQLRELPTDPEGLRRYLLNHPDANERNRQDGQSDSQYLLDCVGVLLVDEPIPAPVRAAAYRMLAALPDARSRQVKDPLGRPGVEIALAESGDYRTGMVIEPSSGRLLAREDLSGEGAHAKVVGWSALIKAGWTDTAPKHATPLPG
ncbi:CU044_5270 family protein [Actinomadura violacea]|uniref:CU044_5270 family protein n=1 Tax=Actinomadura violacea TaxID=2819934 RepID=A0ABS3RMR1_9ACTN|nr:CU044_5270 family protein [Actinomadura violacea]MBO2458040.1 CU044_5270 family protein [Actinomadura violacea]